MLCCGAFVHRASLMAGAGTNAEGASGRTVGDREHHNNVTHQKNSAVDESQHESAAGKRASWEDTAGDAEKPAVGVVLSADELKTPLDMNRTPFENGQLVECQQCWNRMHAPQRSPYLRCFHCTSIVRPETADEKAARLGPVAKVSKNVQPRRAKPKSQPEDGKTKSPMQRTRQPLPKETFTRFETTFQEVKAAEVIPQLFRLHRGRQAFADMMPCHLCCATERSATARYRFRQVTITHRSLPQSHTQT